ncbi:hypothetical protein B0H13DRAFT_2435995 [Mycena leptocephala]|nr:hypothetical protein B0H13DRAFT_2435995 [Mycena leptocephala]
MHSEPKVQTTQSETAPSLHRAQRGASIRWDEHKTLKIGTHGSIPSRTGIAQQITDVQYEDVFGPHLSVGLKSLVKYQRPKVLLFSSVLGIFCFVRPSTKNDMPLYKDSSPQEPTYLLIHAIHSDGNYQPQIDQCLFDNNHLTVDNEQSVLFGSIRGPNGVIQFLQDCGVNRCKDNGNGKNDTCF